MFGQKLVAGQVGLAVVHHAARGYVLHADGFIVSSAELGEAVKNRISHQARALAMLRARWDRLPDSA
jgi:hypothetical protein